MLQKAGYKIQPVVLVISCKGQLINHTFLKLLNLFKAHSAFTILSEKREILYLEEQLLEWQVKTFLLIIFFENAQTKTD